MVNKDKKIDIINIVLEDCLMAFPTSSFIISLYKQYQQRGSLSKKQLQGLLDKASKIPEIVPGKLGTLEAIIKKMPTRYKSELPILNIEEKTDHLSEEIIRRILAKFPAHKRVLFLRARCEKNELLPAEVAELKKFEALLLR